MSETSSTRRWLGLIAIALGVALIVVDTTIVNVIIPSIIEGLDVTSVQGQWIQESYAIVFAALLLVVGRVADIIGVRRVFIAGVVVFGVTSVLAGLASGGGLLIVARFLQGAGAAMILPTSLALLNDNFTGKARGQAFAVWGSTIGAAAALGPLLGGWLAEHASWRWAFGINVPLAVLIVVGVVAFLAPSPRRPGRIDLIGSVLSVLGLGLLAFGLIEGRTYGWITTVHPLEIGGFSWDGGMSPVLVALVLSVLALGGFIWRQAALRRGPSADKALMDLSLFSLASFRNGNIATLIIGLGEFGVVAVLPLWLQFTLGYSALQAGLALVPVAVGSFIASGASFGMAGTASPLWLVRLGLLLEVAGLALLGLIASTGNSWWTIALVLCLYGAGVGFATAQVTNVVLADVPERSSGQASGIQSAFRQLGSALGIAVLTTVFFTTLGSQVENGLKDKGVPAAQAGQYSDAITDSAGAAIQGLDEQPQTQPVAQAGRTAMTDGITLGGYLAAGFVLAGLIGTALIPKPEPDGTDAPHPQAAHVRPGDRSEVIRSSGPGR